MGFDGPMLEELLLAVGGSSGFGRSQGVKWLLEFRQEKRAEAAAQMQDSIVWFLVLESMLPSLGLCSSA